MKEYFPVLHGSEDLDDITAIPYEVIEPHENQAVNNHSQSLEILAKRGGLCWSELYAVLTDKSYKDAINKEEYTERNYMWAVIRLIGLHYCKKK